MSDYVKHGLDEFEDKQTGSLVITPAQMKEKTWQGLTVESAVEDLLKENKEYIKWITDKDGQVLCPNGESKSQYKKRIKEALENNIPARKLEYTEDD